MKKREYTSSADLRKKVRLIDEFLAAIFISFFIITLLNYNYILANLQKEVLLFGLPALFLITFFMELIPNFFNPLLPLFLGVSLGVDLFFATLLVCVGSLLGSFLGFELGKKYGYKLIYPFFEEQTITKVTSFWRRRGKIFVLVSAISPLPYLPIIFGSLDMKRKDFLFWGLIPRLLGFIVAGCLIYLGFLN